MFVNTWSVEGFCSEGLQPAELGWGTHEKALPPNGSTPRLRLRRRDLSDAPGAGTRVRSWTPTAQAQHGFLVTHNESISIADYFTLREDGKVVYRPTCHYAYHPCDDAVLSLHEMAGAAWQPQPEWQILDEDDIVDGIDELGVLLYGHAKNAYWYGSQLSIEETRELAPYQNATGLQVTSAVLAGIVWMLENPDRGIVEADETGLPPLPGSPAALSRAGDRPLHRLDAADGRGGLFPEDVDTTIRGSSGTCWCAGSSSPGFGLLKRRAALSRKGRGLCPLGPRLRTAPRRHDASDRALAPCGRGQRMTLGKRCRVRGRSAHLS